MQNIILGCNNALLRARPDGAERARSPPYIISGGGGRAGPVGARGGFHPGSRLQRFLEVVGKVIRFGIEIVGARSVDEQHLGQAIGPIEEGQRGFDTFVGQRQSEEAQRLSEANNRQADQTRKISGWAAILFAPSLIGSIYGMNFTFMPELSQPWGYPFALGLMLATAVALYILFKKRGWL